MNDKDIRPILTTALLLRASWQRPECTMASQNSRVDYAAIIDDELCGFEIKSEVDTLHRLTPPGGFQVQEFSKLFDRMTLVCARKHLDPALAIIPRWWGVSIPDEEGLHVVRAAARNPGPASGRLARVLWHNELRRVASHFKLGRGCRTKADFIARLEAAPEPELRALVLDALRTRVWLFGKDAVSVASRLGARPKRRRTRSSY